MPIRAIDGSSVHKITSGQVVLDLQSAVKELVENSLDAGATSIELRFKNYGLDSIECVDNGHGIAPEDYESVALKYHTSKLTTFSDLQSVGSFGFRGEALSSLTALANISITTCTKAQEPKAVVLEFERSGKLKPTQSSCARQRGTTVCISDLFSTLPVRRRDLEKNIKREFGKVHVLLTAYALVSTRIKFSVTNQPPSATSNGKKVELIKTEGAATLRAHYGNLFGSKSLQSMVPLDLEFSVQADKAVLKEVGADTSSDLTTQVHVKGLISTPIFGSGRAATDRQFYYVNGRPFNASKISKAVNECFRAILPTQYPCIVANFKLPTSSYDVNVSPDKRTVFIHSEVNLIDALKTSLVDYLETFQSSIQPADAKRSHSYVIQRRQTQQQQSPQTTPSSSKQGSLYSFRSITNATLSSSLTSTSTATGQGQTAMSTGSTSRTISAPARLQEGSEMESPTKRRRVDDDLKGQLNEENEDESDSDGDGDEEPIMDTRMASWSPTKKKIETEKVIVENDKYEKGNEEQPDSSDDIEDGKKDTDCDHKKDRSRGGESIDSSDIDGSEVLEGGRSGVTKVDMIGRIDARSKSNADDQGEDEEDTVETNLSIEMERIKGYWQNYKDFAKRTRENNNGKMKETSKKAGEEKDVDEKDASVLCEDSEKAEKTLTRLIGHKDFEEMEILGQFNLGFIIARLRRNTGENKISDDDLFIIDQHASDEKYNFEQLQENTVIQSQQLIVPKQLHLTAPDELVAGEYMEMIKLNGFEIIVDEEAPVGKRVTLIAHPVSKNTKFDIADLEELLHSLRDGAGVKVVRPKKVRAMLAMRACRKSVMIGKALNKAQMIGIVRHMGTMNQPWSCPHGRPTMRFLTGIPSRKAERRNIEFHWNNLIAD